MYKNLNEESKYLESTKQAFKDAIEDYNIKIKSLYNNINENPLLYESLIESYTHKESIAKKMVDKPYFARIDFNDGRAEYECYIGKVGIFDYDNNPITIDWRAPIASLYYDSNIGNAEYLSPEGIIKGKLTLKRQYEIEKGTLKEYRDVDTVTSDEILKPYLNSDADHRLKNIVATIQNEQNEIIRYPIDKNIIIQGVAGSGKTTVALHRIAYLAYNYRELFTNKDYLVIAPNKFFIKYISGVLPDLDVDGTNEITYDELLKLFITEKFTLKNYNYNLDKALNKENLNIQKEKVSYLYKEKIDVFLQKFFKNYLPKEDLIINGYKIISNSVIRQIYNSTGEYEVFEDKINRTILLISTYIKNNKQFITKELYNQYLEKENTKEYEYIKKELRNDFKLSLKEYFNIKKIKISKIYSEFYKEYYEYDKDIDNKYYEHEDLPALLYINYRIFNTEVFKNIRHTVIDEAQDYGQFHFYVLTKILKNSTFSIYGDLAQSLYSYRSITSWNELNKPKDMYEIKYLNKSYRTTTEILNFANKVNQYLNLSIAEPVIRHGKNVEVLKYTKELFIDKLDDYINRYTTVAIIVKDNLEKTLVKKLINDKVDIITSYEVKGLEYEATIIYNADFNVYNKNNILDMKLLYVSLTRALHEMTVFYSSNLTEVLK